MHDLDNGKLNPEGRNDGRTEWRKGETLYAPAIRGQGGHLDFPISLKSTNMVKYIEILLPVRFLLNCVNGFRGKVEKCPWISGNRQSPISKIQEKIFRVGTILHGRSGNRKQTYFFFRPQSEWHFVSQILRSGTFRHHWYFTNSKRKTDGKLQFFLANKLCQFSRSRIVPHCWPFPCFLGQYHNAVYANYIGPSVMTDANSEGFPMWWKNYLKIKWPMCHKNWHKLQSHPKINYNPNTSGYFHVNFIPGFRLWLHF